MGRSGATVICGLFASLGIGIFIGIYSTDTASPAASVQPTLRERIEKDLHEKLSVAHFGPLANSSVRKQAPALVKGDSTNDHDADRELSAAVDLNGFSRIVRRLSNTRRQLLVVVTNFAFARLTHNLVASLNRTKPSIENYLVVCLDAKAQQYFKSRRLQSFFWNWQTNASVAAVEKKVSRFSDTTASEVYASFMVLKQEVALNVVLLGVNVLMADSDVVFLKNVFHSKVLSNEAHITTQNRKCDDGLEKCHGVSGGFYYVRADFKGLQYLRKVLKAVRNGHGHQRSLNHVMQWLEGTKDEVTVKVLSSRLVPYGEEYFYLCNGFTKEDRAVALAVHMAWHSDCAKTSGWVKIEESIPKKFEAMKKFGLW
eukprot:CAMPEP_0196659728 /NCGR_PEP_ID=MMETSP1086-20130531/36419_1 /TAXON_ID=77921 /ORGANISM="Cyanoptyche  gloeocystis , Strain SAG4.97" /LENGTH=369 /DNA_ID=CAMNT_0041993819 /DNA_START=125 /DNA_END=1231 /DNA_ORIENTATION=+